MGTTFKDILKPGLAYAWSSLKDTYASRIFFKNTSIKGDDVWFEGKMNDDWVIIFLYRANLYNDQRERYWFLSPSGKLFVFQDNVEGQNNILREVKY